VMATRQGKRENAAAGNSASVPQTHVLLIRQDIPHEFILVDPVCGAAPCHGTINSLSYRRIFVSVPPNELC